MPGVVAVLGKGGGGKTTTAATLGAVAAAAGERVVLVDLDSTPTLTAWLAPDLDSDAVSAADVLGGQAAVEDALLTVRDRLDLLPGAVDVAAIESTVKAAAVRGLVLVDAVRRRADVVLLDLRGGVASQLSAAAAAAADVLLVPIEAAPAGVRSLKLSRRLADELGCAITGVLPTRYNSRALVARQLIAALDAAGFPVWPPIRRDVAAEEAPGSGELLDAYAPRSRALADYRVAADRMLRALKESER